MPEKSARCRDRTPKRPKTAVIHKPSGPRQYSFRAGRLFSGIRSSLNLFAFFLKRGDEKSTRLRSSERFYHNFFHFEATEKKNTVPCYRAPNLLIFSCLHCPVSAAQLLIFRTQLYGQFSTSKRQFL